MPGYAARNWRNHVVNMAMLLGYSFVKTSKPGARKFHYELHRDGKIIQKQQPGRTPMTWRWGNEPMMFKYSWSAAVYALKLEGIDAYALNPNGTDGAGAGAVPPVYPQGNRQARTNYLPAKAARRARRRARVVAERAAANRYRLT